MIMEIKKLNLIVSCGRRLERRVLEEIISFLKDLGDPAPIGRTLGFQGIVGCYTTLNIFEVIEKIREAAEKDPWSFRFILKVIPIERTCTADIDEIKETVKELKYKIKENETFKVVVRKRGSILSGQDVIIDVADIFDNPVNLTNPDKIVWIEIINDFAGISILTKKDIVSIAKLKGL